MKRLFVALIVIFATTCAYSQEKVVPDSISGFVTTPESKELNFEMPLPFGESFPATKINLFDQSVFNQPLLPDFNKKLDFKKELYSPSVASQTFQDYRFGFAPFYTGGIVTNQAIYKVSDKFSFGGNSFGAKSVFDRPDLNPSIQNMSTKGASMFMQYKVSKNFKIETRVSVTNHQSAW